MAVAFAFMHEEALVVAAAREPSLQEIYFGHDVAFAVGGDDACTPWSVVRLRSDNTEIATEVHQAIIHT